MTSETYTDTGGCDAVSTTATILPSGRAMVIVTGSVNGNLNTAFLSFSGGGIPADDSRALIQGNATFGFIQASAVYVVTGVTPGEQTFTLAMRKIGGPGGVYLRRQITVIPLP